MSFIGDSLCSLTYSQAERVIERSKRERYGEEYEYDFERRLSDL